MTLLEKSCRRTLSPTQTAVHYFNVFHDAEFYSVTKAGGIFPPDIVSSCQTVISFIVLCVCVCVFSSLDLCVHHHHHHHNHHCCFSFSASLPLLPGQFLVSVPRCLPGVIPFNSSFNVPSLVSSCWHFHTYFFYTELGSWPCDLSQPGFGPATTEFQPSTKLITIF